jgi:hypothetical protein
MIVVPSTGDGFRTAVRTLRSVDGKEFVTSHTFTLQADRFVRLLFKNLDRGMPESVVREDFVSYPWAFVCKLSRSCDQCVTIRTTTRTALPPFT